MGSTGVARDRFTMSDVDTGEPVRMVIELYWILCLCAVHTLSAGVGCTSGRIGGGV